MTDKTNQVKAYHFLIEKEKSGSTFTNEEIDKVANWSGETFKSYRNKLLKGIIHKEKGGDFYVKGLLGVTESEFIEHLSQTAQLKPKSQKLAELVNALDDNNLTEIINSDKFDVFK